MAVTGPRILYLGMDTLLSALPLRALLARGARVVGLVTPARERQTSGAALRRLAPPAAREASAHRALAPPSIARLAWEAAIPLFALARNASPAIWQELSPLAPDLIVVSCYPSRLPRELLALPALGALNVHPSLLPENRGPAPLFWTFRDASGHEPIRTGVTVHQMTGAVDAGPIVLQEALVLPDGLTSAELEPRLAALAADLLPRAITGLVSGALEPRPQDERRATAHAWPAGDDFVITTNRPARWAFNVIRGCGGWGAPLLLRTAGRTFLVTSAVGYEAHDSIPHGTEYADGVLQAQCTPGVVTVTATPCDPASPD